ncbi:MAG: hypothetical protein JWN40_3075 [Phycisphaerales bacterium]|nr:hypothetical protein [Phycisphaerales bacterium]
MRQLKYLLLSLGLFFVGLSPAFAEEQATGVPANQVILKATGPYEDIAHYAVAKKDDKVVKYLADADAGAGEVVKILSPAEAREFESLRQKLHSAVTGNNRTEAADSAVTIFRMLVDRLDAGSLVVPREVELLDFAGYKLAVLAASSKPDWKAIAKLADESDAWWKAIAPRLADKHLRATVTSAIAGTKQAAEQENLAMLQFGSQMILDLVDMLEVAFKNAKANPAAH